MEQESLKSCHCRRRQRSLTDSGKARGDEYRNLTKEFEVTGPFQILSNDISYNRTGEGFDYLCQIRDVYTNIVLASSQAENMKKELVLKTLRAAQDRWRLPAGVIFHSDRGSQYTAAEVKEQAATYGWKQSFSAVGKPGDNAWSESFFSILKKRSSTGASIRPGNLPDNPYSNILRFFTTDDGFRNALATLVPFSS